jgi:hypothetical protein
MFTYGSGHVSRVNRLLRITTLVLVYATIKEFISEVGYNAKQTLPASIVK